MKSEISYDGECRLIPLTDHSVNIVSFLVNGKDYTGTADTPAVSPTDRLDITFSCHHYRDYIVSDTVAALVASGLLSRHDGEYRMNQPKMIPLRHILPLKATGCDIAMLAPRVRLSNRQAGVLGVVNGSDGYVMVFEGPKVECEYRIDILPDKNSRDGFPVGKCRPAELIDSGRSLELAAKIMSPRMRIPEGEHPAVEAVLRSGGLTLVTPVVPGVRLVVPPDTTLLLQAEDYDVKLADGVFDFSPLFRRYELVFPPEFRRMTEGLRIYVISGGKPYRCADDGSVKLPLQNTGTLFLRCVADGRELQMPLSESPDGTLCAGGTVLKNCSPETLKVIAGEDMVSLAPGEIMTLPMDIGVKAADEKTVVVPSYADPSLRIYVVDTRSETVSGETSSGFPMPDNGGKADKDEPSAQGSVFKVIVGIAVAVIIILLMIFCII